MASHQDQTWLPLSICFNNSFKLEIIFLKILVNGIVFYICLIDIDWVWACEE